LDDARTRSTGGVGLGLAIVDEVVELHGGQLGIEDAGPGTRIVVTLPLAAGTDWSVTAERFDSHRGLIIQQSR